jgi:hypothetical protein
VLLISSDSAHSSVIVVVSVPAAKMSYAMQVVNIIINSFFHLVRIERGDPFCPLSCFKISLSLSLSLSLLRQTARALIWLTVDFRGFGCVQNTRSIRTTQAKTKEVREEILPA